MIVKFKPSALRQTRWYEYLVRFVLGGAMTVIAGLIAARFGPVIGGLFLAFPAILSRKRDLDRKACPGTQGESGFLGSAAARKPPRSTPPGLRSEVSGLRLSGL